MNTSFRLTSLLILLAAGACAGEKTPDFDKQDRSAGLTREDYREALRPRAPEPKDQQGTPPIPEAEPLVLSPNLSLPANARLVSVSVNEEAPLREVLVELARQANVGLELDPNISGALIFSVRQRPFEEVVERIADMAGLRYRFSGNVLRIERDTPYLHAYRVDYLNNARKTESKVSTNVDVVGGDVIGAQGGSSGGNTSSSSVSNSSDADFWKELENSLAVMLASSNKRPNLLVGELGANAGLAAASAPGAVATAAIPPLLPAAPGATAQSPDAAANPLGNALDNVTGAATALDILAANGGGPGGGGAGATAAQAAPAAAAAPMTSDEARQLFSVNRTAGLITIFGTKRQHNQIEDYFARLSRTVSGQVLIEAKVLEVRLSDDYESGINWAAALDSVTAATRYGATSVAVPQSGTFSDLATATTGFVTLGIDRGDFDGVINLVQQFGTVRTLSSPRVTVLHNQTAVLKVVENQVFFELDVQREEQQNGDERVTITSNIRSVPEGLVITVQPSIHAETDEVTMTLRPTITRITGQVNDPGVAIASNNTVQSSIPVIAVQEIDSVVTIRSGRVLIMGGLMQDVAVSIDSGVPGASRLPLLGNLFKGRQDAHRQTELVIFLRATIIEGSGARAPDPVDAELYKTFGRDRRPLSF